MACPNCRTLSCYLCRQIITGYEHFNQNPHNPASSSKASSKCVLWDKDLEAMHANEVHFPYFFALRDNILTILFFSGEICCGKGYCGNSCATSGCLDIRSECRVTESGGETSEQCRSCCAFCWCSCGGSSFCSCSCCDAIATGIPASESESESESSGDGS